MNKTYDRLMENIEKSRKNIPELSKHLERQLEELLKLSDDAIEEVEMMVRELHNGKNEFYLYYNKPIDMLKCAVLPRLLEDKNFRACPIENGIKCTINRQGQ